jgi:bifunctional non-homologous end joining protein LigD
MSDSRPLSAVLNFSEGSSDKTYQLQVRAEGDGYVVEFQFGKRNGPLQSGRKTATPVPFEQAEKVFAKLIKEKQAKGYTQSGSGVAYQDTSNQHRVSGFVPQLLNPIDERDAQELIASAQWCAQEKYDGNRTLARVVGGEVTGINRKGLTIPLPEAVATALRHCGGNDFVLDGELVGEVLHVFDVLRDDGCDVTPMPLAVRLAMLNDYRSSEALRIAPTYKSHEDKHTHLERLRAAGAEGCVFKLLSAPYVAGRPNSGGNALKLKFVATVTVRISAITSGKRSAAMQLRDENGNWVDVGNVTIPPNHAIPPISALAEIRYLYAFKGGSIFQPVYLGERKDLDEADCTTAQLQYKGEAAKAA